MAKKKDEKSEEEKALEQRVDEMMSPNKPDFPKEVAEKAETKGGEKVAEVYKPEIPEKPPIIMTLEDEKAAEKASEEVATTEPNDDDNGKDAFDDKETDKAVDDISAHESDKLLAVDDAMAARKQKQAAAVKATSGGKLKKLLKSKWTWLLLLLVLIALFAVPTTRYKILGLAVKRPVTVTVLDSKTASPVSNANVSIGSVTTKTDGSGKAKLNAPLGQRHLTVMKEYYSDGEQAHFVGFKSKPANIKLTATGRLVPVEVVNTITGKPLSGVTIKVLNTTARTNSKGKALVALPTTSDEQAVKLSLAGYNQANTKVVVTDQVVKANTFKLTPTGQIYFLSNATGKIDVVKTNLDGTGRKVIFEGTGQEDQNTTSLLASRDWRYLVLKSKRDSKQSLYLIDTNSDKVTQFDNADGQFELVGWYDQYFVYNLTRNNTPDYQAGRQVLKSYDAANRQLNQLDQNQTEGNAAGYTYQNLYNFYILDGAVAYNTSWYHAGQGGSSLEGKNTTIRAVQPNGQNRRDHQSFPVSSISYIQAALYEPNGVYYAVHANDGKASYYEFEGQAVETAKIDASAFSKPYPTFLISPTSKKTFWSELRDGKNALFTGDAEAKQAKQTPNPDNYATYGWFTDNYLLVSKENSELYILPAGGLSKNQKAVKITDYYKPTRTYSGYGYGYGGL
jgi:hypothetical protein